MYSMEKLARGTILTKEQRESKEKRWNECKALCKIKLSRFLREKPRRGYSVKIAEYKDRPRGKLEE